MIPSQFMSLALSVNEKKEQEVKRSVPSATTMAERCRK